jgi:pimeloyl-ACP methyl ester carboxylesterase
MENSARRILVPYYQRRIHSLGAPPLFRRPTFRCEGEGPVVALIPDICSSESTLEHAADALHDVRVVRPDDGGEGLSLLARKGSIREAALAVLNAIQTLASPRALVVGEGAGGLIAAEMAEVAPLVHRLALVDTPLTADVLRPRTAGASWHIRRRWSAACREFLHEATPLIDRLRRLDRPVLVVQNELALFESLRQPAPGGRIRFTSARDAGQLANAITSFVAPLHDPKSHRFQRGVGRQPTPAAA